MDKNYAGIHILCNWTDGWNIKCFDSKVCQPDKGKEQIAPVGILFFTLILAAIGAKYIGVLILIMPIAAAMAKEQKLDLFLTGIAVAIGGAVGGYGDCGYKCFCREWDYIG